jgi:hypothetical protein
VSVATKAKPEIDDKQIRGWILSDEGLYQEARQFGGGNDEDMYAKLPEFIQQHRARLVEYIEKATS